MAISANAVRKSRIKSQREGMAARAKVNPNAGREKGLYNTTRVTGRTDDREVDSGNKKPYTLTRDSTGAYTGVSFGPNKNFQGLTNDQVQRLIADYKGEPLTADEQDKADRANANRQLDLEAIKKEESNKRLEAKVTPEQLARVGESVPEILNAPNEITAEIQKKQEQKDAQEKLGKILPMTRIDLAAGQAGKLPLVGEFAGGVVENLKRDEAIRNRLESYRMDDEFTLVSDELEFAKGSATQAKKDATRAMTDEEEDSAIQNFNAAWTRIEVIDSQLKSIAMSGDQREWTDSVKAKQREVKYLLEVVRPEKEYQLRLALQGKIRVEDINPDTEFAEEDFNG